MRLEALNFSRSLALLLTVAVVAAVCMTVWSISGAPLLRNARRIDSLQHEVAFLAAAKSRLGDVSRWSQARSDAQAAKADFLQESTPALAASSLQAAMRREALSAGLEIISAEDAAFDEGALKGVSIRMALVGDLAQVTTYLEGLAHLKPVVLIDDIDLRASGAGEAGSRLNVSVTAVSFLWREGER